jgi:predicted regulator of Ras-like GTPase activity (Roadblock/LC7/MglB family)
VKAQFAAFLAPMILIAPASAAEIRVEGSQMSRDFACEDGQDVMIAGAGHKVVLTGRCGAVSVQGADHTLSFEAAGELVVSGVSNIVEGGTTGGLVVETAKNKVKATMKAAETARIDVSGADQTLELMLAGPTQIEVQGAKNAVAWRAEAGVKAPSVSASGIENRISRR